MKKFTFLKTMNLYMRILDAESYFDSCYILEKPENKKILDFTCQWLTILKKDIHKKLLLGYYRRPEHIMPHNLNDIITDLNVKYDALDDIFSNAKYAPIQAPHITLKSMVDEISVVEDEMKISNIHFKNISEYNFTESKMKKPRYQDLLTAPNKNVSAPNVLSMTVIYHNNPLMWPLIFHEYGHTVFSKMKAGTYSKIHEKLRGEAMELGIDNIDELPLKTVISEVFADLFAINYSLSNYYFAFYFHEILSSESTDLLNFNKEGKIKFNTHPPSAIRIRYMQTELGKKNCNSDALRLISKYNKPFAEIISAEIGIDDEKYVRFYYKIYEVVSELFNTVHTEIDSDLIKILHQNMTKKRPIGTRYINETDLKNSLKLNKNFDLAQYNKAFEIIYTGWEYLIQNMIDGLSEAQDKSDYLENTILSPEDTKEDNFENQILKFCKEYDFISKSIMHSIETSMIVSNYLEG